MKSHEVLDKITLQMTRVADNRTLSIELSAHYNSILGDSGIGKTFFFEVLEDSFATGDIVVEAPYPLVFVDSVAGMLAALRIPDRQIVIIDENDVFSQQGAIMNELNSSPHVFLCIGRSMNCCGDYPLQSIYTLYVDEFQWFRVEQPLLARVTQCIQGTIITEASVGRSENQVLGEFFSDVIAASGRNNIQKVLRRVSTGTIFADLGNIGRAYNLLRKRLADNPALCFYDYQSFEQLLYYSKLVIERVKEDNFEYVTIERMYEDLLENAMPEYRHGKVLSVVQSVDAQCLFDSVIGSGILKCVKNSELRRIDAF